MRRMLLMIAALVAALLLAAGLWLYTPDRPRAALEARYAAPPSEFLEVLGLRLHLRDTGPRAAPPVLLLHGFGSSLHTWEDWAARLAPAHRVVRLDLPGFGLTGADPSGDYSDERTVAVLAALLDRLGIPRTVVVGSSMGGRFAWRFAAAYPERVVKLVLMAPDGFASGGVAYGQKQAVPAMARLLRYTLPMAMLRANIAPSYAEPQRLTDAVVARYRDMLLAPGVRAAVLDRMAQSVLPDPVPILRTLRTPTLLLWGEQDAMIPSRNAADYLAALPDARAVLLPGLGHVPMEEAPERALAPVLDFLRE